MSSKWYVRLGSLICGVLSHIYEYLPTVLDLLDRLGFDKWAEKIREIRQRGGMAADDYAEQHEVDLRAAGAFLHRIAAILTAKGNTLIAIADEGVRARAPGEVDAFTEEQMDAFIKALLDQDAELAGLKVAGAEMAEPLRLAASAEIKPDVSRSPALG